MAQQINLCTPILLTQKRYFSAHTMALTLALFIGLGGVLTGVWAWSLQNSDAGFNQIMEAQAQEIDTLKAAIARSKASAAPVDPALTQRLLGQRKAVEQRTQLLAALNQGLLRPGEGHSDRLALIARSIPAPAWVTEVKADSTRFEVSGFTLEPATLNGWVEKLAESPLMHGLNLATVKVEKLTTAAPTASATSVAPAGPPMWSFNLVNVQP